MLGFPLSKAGCILRAKHMRAASIVGSFGHHHALPLHPMVRRINVKGVEVHTLLFFLT